MPTGQPPWTRPVEYNIPHLRQRVKQGVGVGAPNGLRPLRTSRRGRSAQEGTARKAREVRGERRPQENGATAVQEHLCFRGPAVFSTFYSLLFSCSTMKTAALWRLFSWSGRVDSNHRPPAPHAGALTRLRYAPTRSRPKAARHLSGIMPHPGGAVKEDAAPPWEGVRQHFLAEGNHRTAVPSRRRSAGVHPPRRTPQGSRQRGRRGDRATTASRSPENPGAPVGSAPDIVPPCGDRGAAWPRLDTPLRPA